MIIRGPVLAFFVVVCLAATSCEKLPPPEGGGGEGRLNATKFADSIPLEYGRLIAATPNSSNPRWVTLWFEKADQTIVVIGVDQQTWQVWTEPHLIGRK